MTVEEYVEARASVEAFEADYSDGMPPMPVGGIHGFLVAHVTELLQNQFREANQYDLYYVLAGDVGIRFEKPYGADVAVFQRKQFPEGLPAGLIKNTVPLLIVEVVSTYDTVLEVEKKISGYQRAGVGEFWFIKDELNTIDVYRLGLAVLRLGLHDLLPCSLGFTLPVKEILAR
jgi:Uma2 family endonuclease